MKRQEITEFFKEIASRIIRRKSKVEEVPVEQTTPAVTALTPEVNQVETLQPDAVIIEEPALETSHTSVKVSVNADGEINVNVDVSANADVEVSVKVNKKAKPYTHVPHDYATMRDGVRARPGETRYMEVFRPKQLTGLTGSELNLLLESVDMMQEEAKYIDAEQKDPTERQIIIYREVSAICEAIGAGTCNVKPLTYREYHFAIINIIKALNRYVAAHPYAPEVKSIC